MRPTFFWLCLLTHSGCLPLTFAHEGEIDFTVYRSVNVVDVVLSAPDLGLADEASQPTLAAYLVDELRTDSGFRTVTSTYGSAQTQLMVRMRLARVDTGISLTPSDRIDGTVQFELSNQRGAIVVSGEFSQSGSDNDVPGLQASLLDDVAHFFLRPYRI
ncbi:MAG: hypothetical protein VX589_16525 [Myxococcota bacterium]|nr:hypothetical protein [Myxococcota bacterium]